MFWLFRGVSFDMSQILSVIESFPQLSLLLIYAAFMTLNLCLFGRYFCPICPESEICILLLLLVWKFWLNFSGGRKATPERKTPEKCLEEIQLKLKRLRELLLPVLDDGPNFKFETWNITKKTLLLFKFPLPLEITVSLTWIQQLWPVQITGSNRQSWQSRTCHWQWRRARDTWCHIRTGIRQWLLPVCRRYTNLKIFLPIPQLHPESPNA